VHTKINKSNDKLSMPQGLLNKNTHSNTHTHGSGIHVDFKPEVC